MADTSPFYIPATGVTTLARAEVLKADDSFLIADQQGDCGDRGPSAEGLYHKDTRYLSRLGFKLNGTRPLLLGSNLSSGTDTFRAHLTNPDVFADGVKPRICHDPDGLCVPTPPLGDCPWSAWEIGRITFGGVPS
jgi:hypothetical protein